MLANLGQLLPVKNKVTHLGIFSKAKFFSSDLLGFGAWGTMGSWGVIGSVRLVLRTFPELVKRSVLNLVEIGPAVRT